MLNCIVLLVVLYICVSRNLICLSVSISIVNCSAGSMLFKFKWNWRCSSFVPDQIRKLEHTHCQVTFNLIHVTWSG